MFNLIEVLQSVVVMYISLLFFIVVQKHIRAERLYKKLKFTKEDVTERRKEIVLLMNEIHATEDQVDCNYKIIREDAYRNNVVKVLSLYVELAVGINEGIYDEKYIKIVLGTDMMDFYKKYYEHFNHYEIERVYRNFMCLEHLLKKWDT